LTVRFRSEAAADVALARDWYEAQSAGLGDSFVGALERTVELLASLPEAFPEIAMGVRRALLRRFPYALYYSLADGGIDVIACLHTRQSPSRWHRQG